MTPKHVDLTIEDAFHFILRYIRQGRKSPYGTFGYDVYLTNIMRQYLSDTHGLSDQECMAYFPSVSPHFYAAAWDLCRRGVLRPGISHWGQQSTNDGSAGNGYSVTPFGQQWLAESDKDDYVPTEPGRFAEMLDQVGNRFGDKYRERAQQAVICYGAHAYLACCAMCGAAAESIVLALAIAKSGDEAQIVAAYCSGSGRGRIEKLLFGQKPKWMQEEARGYLGLLKYWRDAAAHGHAEGIADNEAFTSLALLLRLSRFASDNWMELVRSSEQ